MSDISKRFQEAISKKDLKPIDIAKRNNVSPQQVNKFVKSQKTITDSFSKVCISEGININWLISGEGEMFTNKEELQSNNSFDDFYTITKLSIHASAGGGIENFHIEEVGQVLLDKELFRYAMNPKSLKVIQVKGDSMQPTIMDDAHVVIDETQREQVDAVYAICLGGQVMIKRLQFNHLNGTVAIRSDNPNYEEQIYNPKESQVPLKILGKKVLVIQ